ncbi:nucleotide-diphospho-sugar transferase [Aspergillus saccharolyticus JOP 1030-1]|uniref:Nucleotide-diphospho-sugar transferase n=1 Tax=Aspergillus saccharolyticus JOP 1030-1 TaxID=1450539 RepID=A0A318ZBE0_9EURO|nr:nucleotide-diphospho-sugar transferase [Aspergillus saccharolyticus JOP 1030-1]PYH44696.1 nucleotide-diphospho-sugar transferase [Aspergillus saccharolyticus JOP 1030-1]
MRTTTFLSALLLSLPLTALAQTCNKNENLKCCKVRESLSDGAVTDMTNGAGIALHDELLGTVGALFLSQQSQFWHHFHPLLTINDPKCPPTLLRRSAGTHRFSPTNPHPRANHILNANAILLPMQIAHDSIRHTIHTIQHKPPYTPGTTGIVTAAASYLPTLLVTLRLLRRTGSTLPVEVFLANTTESDPARPLCQHVLPQLGAQCITLSTRAPGLDKALTSGFQIKPFAQLFSSFESVLWLDADCVPLHDPAALFISDLFTEYGLILWPDFCANTGSPVYFNVSRQEDPGSTVRASSETGMILVHKGRQWRTLLLAAYYNYYGPEYYYPLLGQGAPGTGDKETFLHAAMALHAVVYAVRSPPVDLGRMNTGGKSTVAVNAGFIQADPVQDYAWNVVKTAKRNEGKDLGKEGPGEARAFFIHAGSPEFNPGKTGLLGRRLRGLDGLPARLWTYPAEALAKVGFDAEKTFWEETLAVACEFGGLFEDWEGRAEVLCERVTEHYAAVFGRGGGQG